MALRTLLTHAASTGIPFSSARLSSDEDLHEMAGEAVRQLEAEADRLSRGIAGYPFRDSVERRRELAGQIRAELESSPQLTLPLAA